MCQKSRRGQCRSFWQKIPPLCKESAPLRANPCHRLPLAAKNDANRAAVSSRGAAAVLWLATIYRSFPAMVFGVLLISLSRFFSVTPRRFSVFPFRPKNMRQPPAWGSCQVSRRGAATQGKRIDWLDIDEKEDGAVHELGVSVSSPSHPSGCDADDLDKQMRATPTNISQTHLPRTRRQVRRCRGVWCSRSGRCPSPEINMCNIPLDSSKFPAASHGRREREMERGERGEREKREKGRKQGMLGRQHQGRRHSEILATCLCDESDGNPLPAAP